MRGSKFRGKRLDNGEWVYGGLITDGKGNYAIATLVILNNCHSAVVRLVDPATVGQYTGLKDKNGKEIWDGDVVSTRDAEGYECRRIVVHERGVYIVKELDSTDKAYFNHKEGEVIGNIHDNPELLNQK